MDLEIFSFYFPFLPFPSLPWLAFIPHPPSLYLYAYLITLSFYLL